MKVFNLPKGNYLHISTHYVPLEQSTGTVCDNCGKLIANLVTVKNADTNKVYTIGPDCGENYLQKNVLDQIGLFLKSEQRRVKKISELDKYGIKYVLNAKGIPCFDPETRSGYMIPI
jgi:hypothetical protein